MNESEEALDLTEFPCYASSSVWSFETDPRSPVTRSFRKRSSASRIDADDDDDDLLSSSPSAMDSQTVGKPILLYTQYVSPTTGSELQVTDQPNSSQLMKLKLELEQLLSESKHRMQVLTANHEKVQVWLKKRSTDPDDMVALIQDLPTVEEIKHEEQVVDQDSDQVLDANAVLGEEVDTPLTEVNSTPGGDDKESESAFTPSPSVSISMPDNMNTNSCMDIEDVKMDAVVQSNESPKEHVQVQSDSKMNESLVIDRMSLSPAASIQPGTESTATNVPLQVHHGLDGSPEISSAASETFASLLFPSHASPEPSREMQVISVKDSTIRDTAKRKREEILDEATDQGVTRRSDGTVQLEISNTGTIKIIKAGSSPPPLDTIQKPIDSSSVPSVGGKNLSALVVATPKSRTIKSKDKKKKNEIENTPILPSLPLDNATLLDRIMPKEMTEGDFSKAKPVNQIPLANFISYCEPYFRNITEEDIKWLEKEDDDVLPYVIPSLGVHYREQWSIEDGLAFSTEWDGRVSTPLNGSAATVPYGLSHVELCNKEYEEMDGTVYPGDIYFGPLTERLICSLVEDGVVDACFFHMDSTDVMDGSSRKRAKNRLAQDLVSLEDRIREELTFIGLLDEHVPNNDKRENDEICIELGALQAQLREQVAANAFRRKRLAQVAKLFMAWQEYNMLLDEQNKQIESAYAKRFKTSKKQKKKIKLESIKPPISENALQLINARNKLISELGCMFNMKSFTLPTETIYGDDYSFEFKMDSEE